MSTTLASTDSELQELARTVRNSVVNCDLETEHHFYILVSKAFSYYLRRNPYKFWIMPQFFIPWYPNIPNDKRGVFPDFAIGKYTGSANLPVQIQTGVEIKRYTLPGLPTAAEMSNNENFMHEVHRASFQARDQAKAAVRCKMLPNNCRIKWLVFIGPYFVCLTFDIFTEEELSVRSHAPKRGHQPNDSADHAASIKDAFERNTHPQYHQAYRLGTREADIFLTELLAETEHLLHERLPED